MTEQQLKIALVGAGGKMGMRVSDNLQRSSHDVRYIENSPAGQQRTLDAGRSLTEPKTAVRDADVVILAVPDVALGPVSAQLVPALPSGTVVLTLDPAAAYANLMYQRGDIEYAVAHPCHPSVFLQRKTEAELNDTFGGVAAPQDVVAALESGNADQRAVAETVIRLMYAPVVDVHWVTVKQLAYLEPTLVEVVACMVGDLLNDALQRDHPHRWSARTRRSCHVDGSYPGRPRQRTPRRQPVLRRLPDRHGLRAREDHQGGLDVDLQRRPARPRPQADAPPGQHPPLRPYRRSCELHGVPDPAVTDPGPHHEASEDNLASGHVRRPRWRWPS